jgi:hypothetical protein
MEEYRAYFVGLDGHFTGYEPLVCSGDSEAIEKAKRLVDGHDVELWSGPRLGDWNTKKLNRAVELY